MHAHASHSNTCYVTGFIFLTQRADSKKKISTEIKERRKHEKTNTHTNKIEVLNSVVNCTRWNPMENDNDNNSKKKEKKKKEM